MVSANRQLRRLWLWLHLHLWLRLRFWLGLAEEVSEIEWLAGRRLLLRGWCLDRISSRSKVLRRGLNRGWRNILLRRLRNIDRSSRPISRRLRSLFRWCLWIWLRLRFLLRLFGDFGISNLGSKGIMLGQPLVLFFSQLLG